MLAMFVCGSALGIVVDVYRTTARELHMPRLFTPLIDAVFWVAATWAVFRTLLASNEGELRFYVFLALVIGLWFYFKTASSWIQSLVVKVIDTGKRLLRLLIRLFRLLVIRPVIGLYRLLMIFLGFLAALSIFFYKIVIQCLRPVGKLLLWLLKPLVTPIARHFRKPADRQRFWNAWIAWIRQRFRRK
ncbi:hypothetical protein XYCOK13_01140 [Xylanibacillus composti]|uniref:Spore cortex biosynthesis protein YabQ n=2 Tax=Xylanibacillus composti TaxID=1572762 RepID=A0A8J4LZY2_9BACL|nr:hypothetical protein XYCOK13_01140 [Xylanibacillus composti]